MNLRQAAQQALEALESGDWYIDQLEMIVYSADDTGTHEERAKVQAAITALRQALAEPVQNEPLAWFRLDEKTNEAFLVYFPSADGKDWRPLYAMPRKPLTPREIELLDGMIEVQLHHAAQCDRIANRTMAEKQKGWDMERVALLRKLKAAHGIGEPK